MTRARNLQGETLWLVVTVIAFILAGSLCGWLLLKRWVIQSVRQLESEVGMVAGGDVDHEVVDAGTTVLAYTDGLVERRDEPITAGIERLRQTASVELSVEGLIDHVLASLLPVGASDDVVVLGLQWQP